MAFSNAISIEKYATNRLGELNCVVPICLDTPCPAPNARKSKKTHFAELLIVGEKRHASKGPLENRFCKFPCSLPGSLSRDAPSLQGRLREVGQFPSCRPRVQNRR